MEGMEKAVRRDGEVSRRLLFLNRTPGPATAFDAVVALSEIASLVHLGLVIRTDRQEFELGVLNIA